MISSEPNYSQRLHLLILSHWGMEHPHEFVGNTNIQSRQWACHSHWGLCPEAPDLVEKQRERKGAVGKSLYRGFHRKE